MIERGGSGAVHVHSELRNCSRSPPFTFSSAMLLRRQLLLLPPTHGDELPRWLGYWPLLPSLEHPRVNGLVSWLWYPPFAGPHLQVLKPTTNMRFTGTSRIAPAVDVGVQGASLHVPITVSLLWRTRIIQIFLIIAKSQIFIFIFFLSSSSSSRNFVTCYH